MKLGHIASIDYHYMDMTLDLLFSIAYGLVCIINCLECKFLLVDTSKVKIGCRYRHIWSSNDLGIIDGDLLILIINHIFM